MAKTPVTRPIAPVENTIWQSLFAGFAGLFIAVAMVKFGNAVIFDNKIDAPRELLELIYQTWPTRWGYVLVALLIGIGLKAGKFQVCLDRTTAFGLFLPLVWLCWQFVSATQTVDSTLTIFTLKHFVVCMICFYLGWFCLGKVTNLRPMLLGLLAGFLIVVIVGWDQHFGGLEESRLYFETYVLPTMEESPPPEYLAKLSSKRIFSTLFYPNTLAAAVLLFLPISIAGLWSMSGLFSQGARRFLIGAVSIGALGCLFWSGSKSGWLLALLLVLFSLLQLSWNPALKKGLVIGLLVIGLGAFFIKYADFFQRGATSVVARFDYWRAALEITQDNLVFGTGPGTFLIPYQKIKAPESEMARLCHNDYLEQASDSGIIGFLSFTAFIFGSLFLCRPKAGNRNPLLFAIWLGVAGVSLHSLVEFNLYIPAIAWPTFLFFGWLWSQRVKETNRQESAASVDSARR